MNTRFTGIAALLRLEWLLTVRNRQVLPLYIVFPLIGLALPSLLILLSSKMLLWAQRGDLPGMSSVLLMVKSLASMAQVDLAEAMRQLLLRSSAAYYVLVPTLILPITATFAVVGERQRGTLEAVLATPLSDRRYCLGKLLATWLPAVLLSWLAAFGGAALAALLVHADHGIWMLPDAVWLHGVLMLTPLLALLVALCCLWVSVRARDAQAAVQLCALVLMPVLLLVLSLPGPRMLMNSTVILWTSLLLLVLDLLLLWRVLRALARARLLAN